MAVRMAISRAREQFRTLYTDRLQILGRQFGRPITLEQARALGIDRQIVQTIFSEMLLDERVRTLRLGISDAEVARRIMLTPGFQGPNGQFDRQRSSTCMNKCPIVHTEITKVRQVPAPDRAVPDQ